MGKIKEKFKNLLGEQKEYIKKYYMTFALIAIITLLMEIFLSNPENIEEMYVTLMLTTVLVFAIETATDKNVIRIPLYGVALGLGLLTKFAFFSEDLTNKQYMLICAVYIIAVIYALYKIIKNSEIPISKYLAKVFSNSVIIGLASLILQLGTLFLVTITIALLLKNQDIDLYLRTEILLVGLFMAPAGILGLLNTKGDVPKVIKVIICYIMLPIVTLAEVIIYIYLVKVLVTREIPSNVIYPIVASLFAFAFPTWVMIKAFKDDNKYISFNSKIIPYSFIPLICIQTYSILSRVAQYGITPERYLGIALILFEIIAVILTVIKEHKHLNKILLVAIGFVVIIMCIPGINVLDASWRSQLSRLTEVYKDGTKFNSLSEDAKKQAVGSYRYLRNDEDGKKNIPSYIDKEALYNYNVYSSNYSYYDKYGFESSVYWTNNKKEVEVSGFNKLRKVYYSKYLYNDESFKASDIDTKEFEDVNEIYKEEIKANIQRYVDNAMANGKVYESIIKLSENKSLWISSFNLRYNKETETIISISIEGYLLIK